MRTAHYLLLATLIFFPNLGAQAQQVETNTNGPSLVLVQGDTPNSCSFISADVLTRAVDIVQGLLFVQPGDSPDSVESKMRFVPDRPLADGVLQWTANTGGNYTRAVVNFRDNRAVTRTFTMANKYNQPDERRCQWEVREEQRGTQQDPEQNPSFQSLMPNLPANPVNQVNTNRSTTIRGMLSGGNVSYPKGSRINANGIISTPRGGRTLPNVSIKHGDGSTSHYYRDGSRITIDGTTVPPTGTLIR